MANTVEDYFTDIKDYCQSIDLTELDLDTYCKLLQALETARDHCKDLWEEEEAVKAVRVRRERHRLAVRMQTRGQTLADFFPMPSSGKN